MVLTSLTCFLFRVIHYGAVLLLYPQLDLGFDLGRLLYLSSLPPLFISPLLKYNGDARGFVIAFLCLVSPPPPSFFFFFSFDIALGAFFLLYQGTACILAFSSRKYKHLILVELFSFLVIMIITLTAFVSMGSWYRPVGR